MAKAKSARRQSKVPVIVNSPFKTILLFVSAFFLIAVLIGINFRVTESSQATGSTQYGGK